jgi:hypothetical protein
MRAGVLTFDLGHIGAFLPFSHPKGLSSVFDYVSVRVCETGGNEGRLWQASESSIAQNSLARGTSIDTDTTVLAKSDSEEGR